VVTVDAMTAQDALHRSIRTAMADRARR
jgi:hypothetical protein